METDGIQILKSYGSTQDLAEKNLSAIPSGLVDEVVGLIQEHLTRLRNNCNSPYNGIQQVRELIATKAANIRSLL